MAGHFVLRATAGGVLAFLALPASVDAQTRYDATIVRTTYGIPHISAPDYRGLGYGVGYSAAEDSLCTIAEHRLTVRGERSLHFGPEANATVGFQQITNLESDVFHRAVAEPSAVQRAARALSRDYAALLDGWVAGYNRFIEERAGRLAQPCGDATWIQPMSADDAHLFANAVVLELGIAGLARQIAAAAPPGAGTAAVGLPPARVTEAVGSNGWAFGGDATADGRGLLVGNPHFPWQGPNRFRQMHLTIPGKLDAMGAGLLVTPFVNIGFNRDVAWTHTVTTAQHHTLFELMLDPADPTAYRVDGRSVKMVRRDIEIPVKDGAPVRRTLYATRYGPLLAMPQAGLGWTAARAFAVRDANLGNFRAGDTWLRMTKATNVREVRAIIGDTLGIPYVNTIAADRGGDALYADVTAVPNVDAAKLADCATETGKAPAIVALRQFILDGSRSACDWTRVRGTPAAGLMPEGAMPTLFRRDYVQNANDSYWLTNPAHMLPAASPLVGAVGTRPTFRTQSSITEIERALREGKLDANRAKALAFANRSMAAERAFVDLLALCPRRPALAAACAALRGWDQLANTDSRGALLFFAFLRNAAPAKDIWTQPFDVADPLNTPRGLRPEASDAILDALAAAAAELQKLKIPLDAPLGAVQFAIRGDQRIPIHGGPGSAGILNVISGTPAAGGLIPVHGPSYIQVVGFDAEGPVADALLAYSQSLDPASPHFADQTNAYAEKRWHRLPFTPQAIAGDNPSPPLRISE